MKHQDFNTCIMQIEESGIYKCSLKRKGVWLHSFGKTEMDAFQSMFDLIEEMNNNQNN